MSWCPTGDDDIPRTKPICVPSGDQAGGLFAGGKSAQAGSVRTDEPKTRTTSPGKGVGEDQLGPIRRPRREARRACNEAGLTRRFEQRPGGRAVWIGDPELGVASGGTAD